MKKKYEDKIKIIYKDTDNLKYDIQTEDVYEDMKEMKQYFDTSDYPRDHELFSVENKKVIRKFKDELDGNIFMESIALRPKCYADKVYRAGISKKAKVVRKYVVKKDILR